MIRLAEFVLFWLFVYFVFGTIMYTLKSFFGEHDDD